MSAWLLFISACIWGTWTLLRGNGVKREARRQAVRGMWRSCKGMQARWSRARIKSRPSGYFGVTNLDVSAPAALAWATKSSKDYSVLTRDAFELRLSVRPATQGSLSCLDPAPWQNKRRTLQIPAGGPSAFWVGVRHVTGHWELWTASGSVTGNQMVVVIQYTANLGQVSVRQWCYSALHNQWDSRISQTESDLPVIGISVAAMWLHNNPASTHFHRVREQLTIWATDRNIHHKLLPHYSYYCTVSSC